MMDNRINSGPYSWPFLVRDLRLKGNDVVISWQAYIDESGVHKGSQYVTVAVVRATVESWQQLEGNWKAVLEQFGVSCYHATEVNCRSGEYALWSREKRDDFVKKLLAVALGAELTFAALGVDHKAFKEESDNNPEYDISVYDYLLFNTIANLGGTAIASGHWRMDDGKLVCEDIPTISVFIEAGCNLSTHLCNGLMKLAARKELGGINRILYEDKNLAPLQVADMIAYDTYKELVTNPNPHVVEKRSSFKVLSASGQYDGALISQSYLKNDLLECSQFMKEVIAKIERSTL